jgi:hypothetical protein
VWLANSVVVPKANGKLRMCIDYTNLNKACPKDPYPLPRIDQIVDSTSGCDLLSFIDAYSGFHQIKMVKDDTKHTTFVTVDGLYCYIVMSYGLLNALPTFARAMNITLGDLVRDIVEVYIDDIVVKTTESNSLLENLAQVFDKLRASSTKLNPEKYVFGVSAGKLLGFLVSHRGIEANPDKVRAIEAMRPPARLKDVQRLTGSLAALSRFISRLAERVLPFFKLMKGSGPFTWTEEAERAFREMKQYLISLPVLVAPDPGETLFLYLAATVEVISMVLVTEKFEHLPQGAPVEPPAGEGGPASTSLTTGPTSEGPVRSRPEVTPSDLGSDESPAQAEGSSPAGRVRTVQKPVYYISEVLHDAKARYPVTHKATMSAASCTLSCAAAAVAGTGPTKIGVSAQEGSWLRRQVRMYSAIPRATARPSVSRRLKMAASMCRSCSAVESSAGRTAPSEGGVPMTWMGCSPSASRVRFTSPTHLTIQKTLALRSARNSSTLASLSWRATSRSRSLRVPAASSSSTAAYRSWSSSSRAPPLLRGRQACVLSLPRLPPVLQG